MSSKVTQPKEVGISVTARHSVTDGGFPPYRFPFPDRVCLLCAMSPPPPHVTKIAHVGYSTHMQDSFKVYDPSFCDTRLKSGPWTAATLKTLFS